VSPVRALQTENKTTGKRTTIVRVEWGDVKAIRQGKGYKVKLAENRLPKNVRKYLDQDRQAYRTAKNMSQQTLLFGKAVPQLPSAQIIEKKLLQAAIDSASNIIEQHPYLNYKEFDIKILPKSWARRRPNGIISLDLRVAALPKTHLKYVIAHELAHTIAQNHGPLFRRIVSAICPNWQELHNDLWVYWYYVRLNRVWQRLA